jgi:hypothetical protein
MPLRSVNRLRRNSSRVNDPRGFDTIPMLSTRHQWFPCGPLPASHLTRFFPGLFLLRLRPWLLTAAAEGGLEPAPASRFRGAFPHRSSSYTHWALLGPLRSWRTIVGKSGRRFMLRFEKCLTWPQVKVLNAIERCRTAALGGHRDQCDRCGHQTISYNSCRNRHCPKCQTNARNQWLAARQQELLPVDYYHLVFSVPHALVPLF